MFGELAPSQSNAAAQLPIEEVYKSDLLWECEGHAW